MSPPSILILVPSALERERLDLPDESIAMCGVGLVEAALGTARILAERRPEHVWLAGLGGSRDLERAPLGALVVGSSVRNEAIGAGHGAGFLGLSDMGLADEGDELELVVPELPLPGVEVLVGALGTVGATSAGAEEAAGWHAVHPDVLVEEMEGYAVARAAWAAGVPLSIVRGVSNVAGDRNKARWDIDGACHRLQTILGALLAEGEAGT